MNIEGVESLRAEGHVLSLVANGNLERITQRGRALGAISVDGQPIGLREVFLETLNKEHS